MKRLLGLSFLAAGVVLSGSQAYALSITPTTGVLGTSRFHVSGTSALNAADVCTVVGLSPCTLTDANSYKQDAGGGEFGLTSSYQTTFGGFEEPNEPTSATISYTGGAYFSCGLCYLVVKDGNNGNPAQFIFSLGLLGWDGQEDLLLTGFWEGVKGAISHVAIYGATIDTTDDDITVPEPSSALLLAAGVAVLAQRFRRRKTASIV